MASSRTYSAAALMPDAVMEVPYEGAKAILLNSKEKRGKNMKVLAIFGLWIAAVVLHTLAKGKQIFSKAQSNLSLAGMGASMLAGGVLVSMINGSSRASGAYIHYVNGVRVSEGAYSVMGTFVLWMLLSALINLSALGISYLIARKKK